MPVWHPLKINFNLYLSYVIYFFNFAKSHMGLFFPELNFRGYFFPVPQKTSYEGHGCYLFSKYLIVILFEYKNGE